MLRLKIIALATVLVAGAVAMPVVPARAAMTAFVELSRPQSDDMGRYVGLRQEATKPVMGFVAAGSGLRSVMVNGSPAYVFPTRYRPLGAPEGMSEFGFRVPLVLEPGDPLNVVVTGADGDSRDFVFQPDTGEALARLRALRAERREAFYDLRLANALAAEEDYGEAFPLFDSFAVAEPGFVFGPFFEGLAFEDDDDDFDALRFFRRTVDLDDAFIPGHLELGDEFVRTRDFDRAEREFGTVLRRNPDLAEAHFRLGEALSARGDFRNAQKELNQAVSVNPTMAPAHFALGRALAAQGRNEDASRAFSEALRVNPKFSAAYHNMGALSQEQGNLGQATEQYQNALRLNPSSAPAHYGLGTVMQKQGNTEGAANEFGKAMQLNPRMGEAYHGMAQTMYQRGAYGAAWNNLHQAQQLGIQPDRGFVSQLRTKMPEPQMQMRPATPMGAGHMKYR
ncbi:MAG: tetratricopeptide repeat protein [Armatimonadia bacterium]